MHYTQTIDRDTKQVTTYGVTISLFNNHLHLQWKSMQDERPYYSIDVLHNFYKKENGGKYLYQRQRFRFTYSKEDGFSYNIPLLIKIKKKIIRCIHYKEIRSLMKQILDLEKSIRDIWEDPMCGCPEDFAYDWNKKIRYLEQKLDKFY